MTAVSSVLYAAHYGRPIYDLVKSECPAELSVQFLERGDDNELLARLADVQFVIGGKLAKRHFQAAPHLRLLQCLGVGYNGVDIEAARERGVVVAATPEATVEGVAEHVVLMALAVNKRLLTADSATRRGEWPVWQLRPTSHSLFGHTVGLIGLGRIGREVARRLAGFGVDLVYHDPVRASQDVETEYRLQWLPFDELLARADVVTLHTPLTPATRKLIGPRELSLMKSSSILINTSRGEVVEEEALIDALRLQKIRGAGLDVFEQEPIAPDNPLLFMEQVVVTPHIATGTLQAMKIKTRAQFANCLRILRGEAPLNRVA